MSVDFNKLIARAKAILLTPKTEWPVIATEPATVGDLYKNYILVLAAIPAVATFIKTSIIGTNVWLAGRVRTDVGTGLASMVLSYVLVLASVYVMALIIDALAPTFGGQKDKTQALKTITYASTASWLAGVAVVVPAIGMLIALAGGIYGIYLLYLGLPHTMKSAPEKSAGYTAVSIIAAIVLYIVVGAIVGTVAGVGLGIGGGSSYSGDVQVDKDSALGKLEKWGKDVEEASKKLEAAQESGDQQAQTDALSQMMGAALGGGGAVEALPTDRLKPFLPESLMGMPRTDFSVERNGAMGMQITEARATYADDATGRSVDLEIVDTGSAKGLLAMAGFSGVEGETETDGTVEKIYREDGRLVREYWDRPGSTGEYMVVLGERFTVKVQGGAEELDDLKAALSDVDLSELEALKDEGVKK
jgi:hypothetical protein